MIADHKGRDFNLNSIANELRARMQARRHVSPSLARTALRMRTRAEQPAHTRPSRARSRRPHICTSTRPVCSCVLGLLSACRWTSPTRTRGARSTSSSRTATCPRTAATPSVGADGWRRASVPWYTGAGACKPLHTFNSLCARPINSYKVTAQARPTVPHNDPPPIAIYVRQGFCERCQRGVLWPFVFLAAVRPCRAC